MRQNWRLVPQGGTQSRQQHWIAPTPGNLGYWLVTQGGLQNTYGNAVNLSPLFSGAPVVGVADASADGYWWAASDGGVFTVGTAPFFGSVGGTSLNAPVVGIASTPDHGGYWLAAADGGVFGFGDAKFYGSVPGVLQPGQSLNAPVVGIAGNTLGGNWLVASDGGIFAFNAAFNGSLGSTVLNASITGMATTDDGQGYWMVAGDGRVFAFGDAPFWGSAG